MSNPINQIDWYKYSHKRQYPEGTEFVYSNFTARSGKWANIPDSKGTVFFGLSYFIQKYLIEDFNRNFFNKPKDQVVSQYKRRVETSLGGVADTTGIEELHDLGYLPIRISAVPEGSFVPYGVPSLIIYNTDPRFAWLTNYLETILSCYLWKPCTSATTARWYRKLLEEYAEKTGGSKEFIDFQAHDFSFRGMSGPEDAAISGAAHLLFFKGTDTVPAIDLLEEYYAADATISLIGASVPASEHSVMSMGTQLNERDTYRRFIKELYPTGIVSIVSDTWDYWNVLTNIVPSLKDDIMSRDGKVVIRPDSGDPVKIICGDPEAPEGSPERKGSLVLLWETFGGIVNDKGFKHLDPHIGLIYGDSITPQRAQAILEGMTELGFASDNIVFGVGSYTYNVVSRDTHGFAVKATYGEVEGQPRIIFKDPVTDKDKVKKSLRGMIAVTRDQNNGWTYSDGLTWDDSFNDDLLLYFSEGHLYYMPCVESIAEEINLQSNQKR